MAANIDPIFALTPNYSVGKSITTANTAIDGTGTVVTVYTAGANGDAPTGIIFRGLGTNVATVARIFVNNGSTNATTTNNALIGEITLSATTLSQTSALANYYWPFPDGFRLQASHTINITIGTTVAAGYEVLCHGGSF